MVDGYPPNLILKSESARSRLDIPPEEASLPRDVRQASNQAVFRDVNNRIAELAAAFGGQPAHYSFMCECARLGCTAQIELPLSDYAAVRDLPSAYLVVAGHEDRRREEVIADHGTYVIVRAFIADAGAEWPDTVPEELREPGASHSGSGDDPGGRDVDGPAGTAVASARARTGAA